MLRVAICDDEKPAQEQIRDMLMEFSRQYKRKLEIICFSTGEELLSAPFNYDILFLDIQLDSGNDGISLGQILRTKNNNALFIISTLVVDRHRDGYKAGVHRYLEKPIRQEELNEALITALQSLECADSKIDIRFKTEAWVVNIEDILYIESYNRKRYVHMPTEVLITLEPLEQLEERLPEKLFYRPQKSFLVNLAHVAKADRMTITMADEKTIAFVKGRYEEFNRRLMRYLGEEKE